MKRKKLSPKKSKKSFTRGAVRTSSLNNYMPMRGGIRL